MRRDKAEGQRKRRERERVMTMHSDRKKARERERELRKFANDFKKSYPVELGIKNGLKLEQNMSCTWNINKRRKKCFIYLTRQRL